MTQTSDSWKIDPNRPVFIQIMEIIKNRIASGIYQPGDKLPSVREIAHSAAVNPNTVQKALAELERTGLIYSQRAVGRFVTEDENQILGAKEESVDALVKAYFVGMGALGYNPQEAILLLEKNRNFSKEYDYCML